MNKRNLGILVIVIVCALAVGLLVYYLIFYNYQKSGVKQTMSPAINTPVATLVTNTPKTENTATGTTAQVPLSVEDDIIQQDASQVAKIFVGRFGTYSNQAGVEQFSDLKLFVTAKMQTWVDEQVAKILSGQPDYNIYHVVVTKVVSVNISSLNKTTGTATVVVNARRTDQTGDEAEKITNPEIKLEVVKAGKRWKVDSVVWQ